MMDGQSCPVDVISVCSRQGQIRPLRLRMEDEYQQMVRVDIEEVVSVRTTDYVGVEAQVFLCRARLWGRERLLELKYDLRRHIWKIQRLID